MKADTKNISLKYRGKIKKLKNVDHVVNNRYAVKFSNKILRESPIKRASFIKKMVSPLNYSYFSMGPTQPFHWYYFCSNLKIDPFVILDDIKLKKLIEKKNGPILNLETLRFGLHYDPSEEFKKEILNEYIINFIPLPILEREFGINPHRFKSFLNCGRLINCTEAYKIFHLFSIDPSKILDNPREADIDIKKIICSSEKD